MPFVRPFFRSALLVCLVAAPLLARAQAEGEDPVGEADPTEENWGDEWYDEEGKKRAADEERRVKELFAAPVPPGPTAPPVAPPPPVVVAPTKPAGPVLPPNGKAPPERIVGGKPVPPPVAPTGVAPELQKKAAEELARPIVLTTRTFADVDALFRARRDALLKGDLKTAGERERELLALLEELDLPEVHPIAIAIARESAKLEATSPAEAVARAELAVKLGPSLSATHVRLARARFARDPTDVLGWARPLGTGISRLFLEQRTLRPLGVDALTALMTAIFAAGAAIALLLFARSLRYFLHDFHHLFPRGASPLQTALLALILVALPFVFRLGPFAIFATLLAVSWFYLERSERIVAGLWLAMAGGAPLLVGLAADQLAWDGTPAESVYAVERGGDFSQLPALEAAANGGATPQVLFAVARAQKREGRLEEARALYDRVLETNGKWPWALVNAGNVRFLQGDLDAAERFYMRAVDAQPGYAPAQFNLSRVHYRRVNLNLGQETRNKVLELDRTLLQRYAAGDRKDQPALGNVYLLDGALPDAELHAIARPNVVSDHVARQVAGRVFGPFPTGLAPAISLGVLALLVLLALAQDRLVPARSCGKCGRPVCRRCDPETGGGGLCGQCVNVFARKAVVDPVAKVQKELAVRRYAQRRSTALKVLAFFVGAQVAGGRIVRGAIFLFLVSLVGALIVQREGVARTAFDAFPEAWKLALLVPFGLAVYAFSVRDGFRGDA